MRQHRYAGICWREYTPRFYAVTKITDNVRHRHTPMYAVICDDMRRASLPPPPAATL